MKKILFKFLFTSKERRAIINALWKRAAFDSGENNEAQNKEIRANCEKLARKYSFV